MYHNDGLHEQLEALRQANRRPQEMSRVVKNAVNWPNSAQARERRASERVSHADAAAQGYEHGTG